MQCSKSYVDAILQPVCRVLVEEGRMAMYLRCMKCSKKGIKSEQAEINT